MLADTAAAFKELEELVLALQGELAFYRGAARRAEARLNAARETGTAGPPPQYSANDLLTFEEAREWWKVSARTCERMRLPWSNPIAKRRLRRILFSDLLKHYRNNQNSQA